MSDDTRRQQAEDLAGLTFGLVTALRQATTGSNGGARWWVRCQCGVERVVSAIHLKQSPPRSHQSCRSRHRRRS